jgi:hypothetical protein
MKSGYRVLKDAIYECPLVIPSMTKTLVKIADWYLPYSTGIEIECSSTYDYSETPFIDLGLITVNTDQSEQRYRFNTGVKGLIEIYKTCELLKKLSLLNLNSGIHYHIDLTDCFDKVVNAYKTNENCFNWILDELDSWGYTGNFNDRKVTRYKTYVKLHSLYKTVEIRIGEMTFDYKLMITRILHCQNIAKKVRKQVAA